MLSYEKKKNHPEYSTGPPRKRPSRQSRHFEGKSSCWCLRKDRPLGWVFLVRRSVPLCAAVDCYGSRCTATATTADLAMAMDGGWWEQRASPDGRCWHCRSFVRFVNGVRTYGKNYYDTILTYLILPALFRLPLPRW
jgi:hypothetical protein